MRKQTNICSSLIHARESNSKLIRNGSGNRRNYFKFRFSDDWKLCVESVRRLNGRYGARPRRKISRNRLCDSCSSRFKWTLAQPMLSSSFRRPFFPRMLDEIDEKSIVCIERKHRICLTYSMTRYIREKADAETPQAVAPRKRKKKKVVEMD